MQAIQDFIIFFFFFFSLLSFAHFLYANTIPKTQQYSIDHQALLSIQAEISNDPDSVLSSWSNNSLHFCHWRGVTCGRRHNQRVVALDLSSSKLVGTLSPFIGNLTFLHKLNLTDNSFHGDIPRQISRLTRLQKLSLASNLFEGTIPANLSRCLQLFFLNLSNNKLVGIIPSELATLPNLVALHLYSNNLHGRLQDTEIGNMTSLRELYLDTNRLQGSIPDDIGKLKGLIYLTLGGNTLLSGPIPPSLFNLSNLIELSIGVTNINGNLPQDLGLRLSQLRYLSMENTSLTGQFPTSLSNLSELINLEMAENSFEGEFYLNGNNMPNLMYFNMASSFSTRESRDIGFIDTLTNCTNLSTLVLGDNFFTGTFPHSILNLSTSLEVLVLGMNQLSGQIPFGLGKFVNLYFLDFQSNYLIGSIPSDISQLKSIGSMAFSSNNLSSGIPNSLGNLTFLSRLYLENNNLEGLIPSSLGNCINLQTLSLQSNKLSGVLPVELFSASSLIHIEIGQNNLQGSLPLEISLLKNLVELKLSKNRFSGEIPSTLGGCTSLTTLDLSGNSFVGSIPDSLSPLKSIQTLDLSCNHLSGQIPSYFSSWPYLSTLNLSFNNLEGEVPTNGVFASTSVVSVVGNNKLCGGVFDLHLQKCTSPKELKRRRLSLALIVIISIGCALILVSSVALCLYMLCSSRKRKEASSGLENIKPFLEVSYQMLLRATNGFSPSNLIGVGGFGSVYKGILHQDGTETEVAIKVLNLQNQGASKSFISECKALSNIRHRNLVKIITICSSIDAQRNDFKALVYEYMSRGSLDSWVHSNLVSREQAVDDQSCSLSLLQRLNIAIYVASALEYLHIGCTIPILHCDLKPTNILLDEEMTAHVADFGLAKFLSGASVSNPTNQTSSTQVRGTLGYASPEYGLGSKVSPKGDIYSFGITVLEMMTSKRPTDPMFKEGLNLHEFSKSALPDQVMEIIDQRMLGDASLLPARSSGDVMKIECIKSLITVGVQCSLAQPQERMSISNALNELKSARQNILSRGPRNHITT